MQIISRESFDMMFAKRFALYEIKLFCESKCKYCSVEAREVCDVSE